VNRHGTASNKPINRTLKYACLTLALWIIPNLALAQTAGFAGNPIQENLEAPLFPGTPFELEREWLTASSGLEKGEFGTARFHLDKVAAMRTELGIANLNEMSLIVAQHARIASNLGDSAEAGELMALARRLAPSAHFASMESVAITAETDMWNWAGMFRDSVRGSKALWNNINGRLLIEGRMWAAGILSVFWAIIFFGLILLIRHGPRLAHDLSHFFPKAIRGAPFLILGAVALVVAPLTVGVGLVLISLTWLVCLWAYLNWSERLVAGLLTGALFFTPYANRHIEAAMSLPGSIQQTIFECSHSLCVGDQSRHLNSAAVGEQWTADHRVTLGLLRKRRAFGKTPKALILHDAVRHFRAATLADEYSYDAKVNLANALYVQANQRCRKGLENQKAQWNKIEILYRDATRLKKQPIEALYNLSVLSTQMDDIVGASRLLDAALAIDPERVNLKREIAGGSVARGCPLQFEGNKRLMDALPSVSRLKDSLVSGTSAVGPVLVPYSTLLSGIVDVDFLRWSGLVVSILLLVGGLAAKLLRPAHRCRECRRLACAYCRSELRTLDLCETCLFVRVQGGFVDARTKWLREQKLHGQKGRFSALGRAMSLIVPGLGQWIRGNSIMGLVFLLSFSFLFFWVLGGQGTLPSLDQGAGLTVISSAAIISAVVVYLISAIHALKGR